MPKIFISYRRKSWPFTDRLVEELAKRLDTEIFIDRTSIDQADFERSILHHLRSSDAVLLVISEYTFEDRIHRDDDWVRREIREALIQQKPLVLVCVEGRLPPAGLPDDIKDVVRMQGINFYPEYFSPGVDKLADFIVTLGVAQRGNRAVPTVTTGEKPISGQATLNEALDLMERGDFHKAAFLFDSLRASGYTSRYVKLDELLAHAQTEAAQADLRQQAQQAYDEIAAMAARTITVERARATFEQWRMDFPSLVEDLDTGNLRGRFQPVVPPPPRRNLANAIRAIIGDPFEWIAIPGSIGKTWTGAPYHIAKYPVTNAQFAPFIQAGGYRERRWWTAAGWEAREKEKWTEPRYWRDARWNRAEQPVVGVSWYEAVAYCTWLSDRTGENILLPTDDQWQYAAQGDDGRAFPWGNEWDCARCNNSVPPCKDTATTPVHQYEGKGDSFFGVTDMAGNLWEWCLTDSKLINNNINMYSEYRVQRGGSWNNSTADFFRCAFRFGNAPHVRYLDRGFRFALS